MDEGDSLGSIASELEADAFRQLFPLRFHERYIGESIRADGRKLGMSRETTLALGAIASADGSAMAKVGCTTMLAGIKLEVMSPSTDTPEEGGIAIDFHMPPICSRNVRPGRPSEVSPVLSKQLSDTILSSSVVDLKQLCLVKGSSAWMVYLDIYCLDDDGALFDAALLAAIAALSHLEIPAVSVGEDGRAVLVSEEESGKGVNKERKKLTLMNTVSSLTCVLHKEWILADPTAEEEATMGTLLTVVIDSHGRLISLYKPGCSIPVTASTIRSCIALTRKRAEELQSNLSEALSEMGID